MYTCISLYAERGYLSRVQVEIIAMNSSDVSAKYTVRQNFQTISLWKISLIY